MRLSTVSRLASEVTGWDMSPVGQLGRRIRFFLAFDRRREAKILETRQRQMGFHS